MEQLQKLCPACGAPFTCEYELGKDCWCAKKFPAIMPMKNLERGCYCEKCLERKVREAPDHRS
ncbi:MAG: cysteine-rich CWC family protein [Pyrinomonadaceae bacterium]